MRRVRLHQLPDGQTATRGAHRVLTILCALVEDFERLHVEGKRGRWSLDSVDGFTRIAYPEAFAWTLAFQPDGQTFGRTLPFGSQWTVTVCWGAFKQGRLNVRKANLRQAQHDTELIVEGADA